MNEPASNPPQNHHPDTDTDPAPATAPEPLHPAHHDHDREPGPGVRRVRAVRRARHRQQWPLPHTRTRPWWLRAARGAAVIGLALTALLLVCAAVSAATWCGGW